ncbi:hypothetical protein ASPWEDRAFT_176844 [Aspergillus wentii DTO 134E9]|uniref:Uncharacterized protein n=1 Tax=Aspergillus wentii DTO 134E9 TaxID=1073089 RepID=A0A1L9R5J0_ASPWE|nr:uncharacterized protein ASPWEDRAFT_176844 [Aspergillus wentii DTO 134E9]KAI9925329.1 hypothetical protein MW887_006257 [Aspergillus wentii]OJJ30174.1 hypothetical protein ASPWEDRAFT_176844 [Aspergillus wentii DTO 134E9]
MHAVFGLLVFESLNGPFGPSCALVKHLWRRPDLAFSARKVGYSIYDCHRDRFDRKDESHRYDSEDESDEEDSYKDKEIIEEMANEVSSGRDWFWWQGHLKKRCDDAWLAVLLARLTHLESLTLDP